MALPKLKRTVIFVQPFIIDIQKFRDDWEKNFERKRKSEKGRKEKREIDTRY